MSGEEGYTTTVEDPKGFTILVTGAGGYIGSHACLALLEAGFNVVAIDNLVNCWKDERLSQPESLIRVQILAGRQLKFYHGELLCKKSLEGIFEDIIAQFNKIDVCMHFAALKAVGESCAKPLQYYKNNITGTINLIELLEKFGCKSLVYSSSATVYGDPAKLPISEDDLTGVGLTNPYGKTKFMAEEIFKDLCNAVQTDALLSNPRITRTSNNVEQEVKNLLKTVVEDIAHAEERHSKCDPLLDVILSRETLFFRTIVKAFVRNREKLPICEDSFRGVACTSPEGKTKFICEEIFKDLTVANKDWRVISLRYFNPVGAHISGLIGEDPNGIPNNLVPFVAQVAAGKLDKLKVFGGDYPTKDGTGVRDYLHITDLINGHIKALELILKDFQGFKAYNLGTGKGYSVLDVIRAFKEASGRDIPYEIVERRAGDIAASYCNASLAEKELKWVAIRDINDMCRDVWRWQSRNINGYKKETDPNCLLHSPKKLELLLSRLTETEMQMADRRLHIEAVDAIDKIKQQENFEKLKRLRDVLKASELLRLSQDPCKQHYKPDPMYSRINVDQAKIQEGYEKLKKLHDTVKSQLSQIDSLKTCECSQALQQTGEIDLPFCACGHKAA